MSQPSEPGETVRGGRERPRLPLNVALLGCVSLLTTISSAMVYSLLPVFLVKVLGASMGFVGVIEGAAEAANSLMRVLSGVVSDWLGRRKPLLIIGYTMSAVNKLLFPIADSASIVLAARVIDRVGKGTRDAPRDAFMTDLIPSEIRGAGFGLRTTFYTTGFVLGPLAAIGLMMLSGDNFRLVFWVAVIPAFLAIAVLLFAVKEASNNMAGGESFPGIHVGDLVRLPGLFWWSMAIACLLALARFSMAFLVLKAHDVGLDAAFVPMMLVLMHAVYSAAAYPFGLLADYMDRRLQLGLGALLLITAQVVLASAATVEMAALGAALWGLQFAVTQGLLAASIADAAPDNLRGTAFGIYDLATGVATFAASAGAGVLWMIGGPVLTFGTGAGVAALAALMLLVRPMPNLAKLPARR